jgi:phage shock protein PspC (stress-responsive transcriptional regulator)/signal transduction histidine kinase
LLKVEMAAESRPGRRRLARDRSNAVVAGVCSGLARRLGIDPIIVRIGFVVVAVATRGGAVAAYVLLWVFMDEGDLEPAPGDVNRVEAVVARIKVGNWRIAAGAGFLTLAFLLVLREIGLWWSDALAWPLILAASGAALIWSQSSRTPTDLSMSQPSSDPGAPGGEAEEAGGTSGIRDVYRGGFGIALVVGAALLFLYANGALGQARDVVLAVVVAGTALALILLPFLWRLGRNLADERSERIRSQERAEVAAHLHDSVLQTLALMQKRADDPKEVATLARRQERELRSWLFDGDRSSAGEGLAAALDRVAAEVEDAHGVPIDVVAVGDRPLDEHCVALVAATREALTNAAKFAADAAPVAVYAEMSDEGAQVFVRDRGPGFDAAAIPADRRGVRESIIARMERHGGKATIRSTPGAGTEVELALGDEAR